MSIVFSLFSKIEIQECILIFHRTSTGTPIFPNRLFPPSKLLTVNNIMWSGCDIYIAYVHNIMKIIEAPREASVEINDDTNFWFQIPSIDKNETMI